MIAVLIGSVVTGMTLALTIFVVRANAVLFPQMDRQVSTSRALMAASDYLRNGVADSVTFYQGNTEVLSNEIADRVDFEHVGMPVGQVSSIRFEDDQLVFRPDTTSDSDVRVLVDDLESVEFTRIPSAIRDSRIRITAVFMYRKFRGYDSNDQERMNGTITTEVWPRN